MEPNHNEHKLQMKNIDLVDPTREIMRLFESDNHNGATQGTLRQFIVKSFLIFSGVAAFKFLFNEYFPTVVEVVFIPLITLAAVFGIPYLFDKLNTLSAKRSSAFLLFILVLFAGIMLLSTV